MSEEKSKKQQLDDFWDISSLVPKKHIARPASKSTSTVMVTDGVETSINKNNKLSQSTLIERFIPPHTADNTVRERKELFSYIPENSLLHKVTVFKQNTSYDFYREFCLSAKKLWNIHGEKCEYADFFSYSPQYDQLSEKQLGYYLWWRENLRNDMYIKTNISYLYLYTFELINTAKQDNAQYCLDMMMRVLINYENVLLGAKAKYIRWITDFGLVHKLPPPKGMGESVLKSAGALKEYFVTVEGNTYDGWAKMLLGYCCSYDYKTSKFAVGENREIYDIHVHGAITEVVKKLSENGKILGGLTFDDCKICAPAFEGALCSSENRFIIEVEYCSFSRSHELRFLIGDAVKYAENKIRTYLSVKSKLSVYSLPNDLCEVINRYFEAVLPTPRKIQEKKQERQEYDVLYDLPRNVLNISNADKIESESWNVTRELVEAFDVTENTIPQLSYEPPKIPIDETDIKARLGEYLEAVISLKTNDTSPLCALARENAKPVEAVVDTINEIAVDIIGDILIEEVDGIYAIIEDYSDLLD